MKKIISLLLLLFFFTACGKSTPQDYFQGKVKEVDRDKILVTIQSKPEKTDIMYDKGDEVYLLTEGVELKGDRSQIKKGTVLDIYFTDNPINTMSIPPQVPGNSIKKIIVE